MCDSVWSLVWSVVVNMCALLCVHMYVCAVCECVRACVFARACVCVYVCVTYNSRSMSSPSLDVITLDFMLMLGLVNAASRCCHFRRLQINGVGVIINLSGVMGV